MKRDWRTSRSRPSPSHQVSQAQWWKKHITSRQSSLTTEPDVEVGPLDCGPQVHSHAHHHDLGMNAVLIHVLGDTLNSISVIIAAAVIGKTMSEKRFYADPAMSLVIGFMLILTASKLGMYSRRVETI